MILAIDPGNIESAYVYFDGVLPVHFGKVKNEQFLEEHMHGEYVPGRNLVHVYCEQVRCYGMAVGASILDTVEWSGRFHEASVGKFAGWKYIPRIDVKVHLCKRGNANDSNVRQALIDRFGLPGKKHAPGVLYGVAGDVWAALALAVTAHDKGKP